ncbi:phosphoglycolate phosphatase [Tropicibacter sp. Alg240-R139]|uniref:phosphoglycolate phosphatase n=1 Tax=Tropicibacter sp. Alg240-R139 TaxID=2305991 RepID=UPI0013DFBF87|nr:phosphoglycolate phosphatase [Tropicibacter sp. Alg240-R139]
MTASIVFDLDGTLIDSAPDIAAAVNAMLADEGYESLEQATVTSFVGHGILHLTGLVIRHVGLNMDRHTELTAATLAHYNQSSSALTAVYPGVIDALDTFQARGLKMGICTNKPEASARHELKMFNLERYFDVVIGGDSLSKRKPDPAPLQTAFDSLGPRQHIFVGDSEVDAETAQRAGVPFLLFTSGYRKTPVAELPHTATFDDSAGLIAAVDQLLGS